MFVCFCLSSASPTILNPLHFYHSPTFTFLNLPLSSPLPFSPPTHITIPTTFCFYPQPQPLSIIPVSFCHYFPYSSLLSTVHNPSTLFYLFSLSFGYPPVTPLCEPFGYPSVGYPPVILRLSSCYSSLSTLCLPSGCPPVTPLCLLSVYPLVVLWLSSGYLWLSSCYSPLSTLRLSSGYSPLVILRLLPSVYSLSTLRLSSCYSSLSTFCLPSGYPSVTPLCLSSGYPLVILLLLPSVYPLFTLRLLPSGYSHLVTLWLLTGYSPPFNLWSVLSPEFGHLDPTSQPSTNTESGGGVGLRATSHDVRPHVSCNSDPLPQKKPSQRYYSRSQPSSSGFRLDLTDIVGRPLPSQGPFFIIGHTHTLRSPIPPTANNGVAGVRLFRSRC